MFKMLFAILKVSQLPSVVSSHSDNRNIDLTIALPLDPELVVDKNPSMNL